MYKVFGNMAKPYAEEDSVNEESFESVTEFCEMLQDADNIVKWVYECYPEEVQQAELIVRVPQILSHYQNNLEKLNELRNTFSELFSYYERVCMPKICEALQELRSPNENENSSSNEQPEENALVEQINLQESPQSYAHYAPQIIYVPGNFSRPSSQNECACCVQLMWICYYVFLFILVVITCVLIKIDIDCADPSSKLNSCKDFPESHNYNGKKFSRNL
jgi:hypothetical protein